MKNILLKTLLAVGLGFVFMSQVQAKGPKIPHLVLREGSSGVVLQPVVLPLPVLVPVPVPVPEPRRAAPEQDVRLGLAQGLSAESAEYEDVMRLQQARDESVLAAALAISKREADERKEHEEIERACAISDVEFFDSPTFVPAPAPAPAPLSFAGINDDNSSVEASDDDDGGEQEGGGVVGLYVQPVVAPLTHRAEETVLEDEGSELADAIALSLASQTKLALSAQCIYRGHVGRKKAALERATRIAASDSSLGVASSGAGEGLVDEGKDALVDDEVVLAPTKMTKAQRRAQKEQRRAQELAAEEDGKELALVAVQKKAAELQDALALLPVLLYTKGSISLIHPEVNKLLVELVSKGSVKNTFKGLGKLAEKQVAWFRTIESALLDNNLYVEHLPNLRQASVLVMQVIELASGTLQVGGDKSLSAIMPKMIVEEFVKEIVQLQVMQGQIAQGKTKFKSVPGDLLERLTAIIAASA